MRLHAKILFFTNEELGQANVFLTTCEAVLRQDPNAEIHLASFAGLARLADAVNNQLHRARPIQFHQIRAMSMKQAIPKAIADRAIACHRDSYPLSFFAPLSFANSFRAIRDTVPILVPYDGPSLVEAVSSVVDIIEQVAADLVVVDSLMTPALTACRHLGINFVCLSPNSIKDFATLHQPLRRRLQYPALFSGYRFPVPWHQRPLNILYKIAAAVLYFRDRYRQETAAHLTSHLGAKLTTTIELYFAGNDVAKPTTFVGTLPELDFPAAVPSHLVPCGPIIRNAPPVRDADPHLEGWLARGPTLYVNLGSLCPIAETQARELALAIKSVLDALPRLQVLWKLKRDGDYSVSKPGDCIHDALNEELKADRVRVAIDWLSVEPSSILGSGHVVCSMHHGGANSFFEAVVAGVPHVVLPQWTDTYDYAERVEFLGIGRLGNRSTMPRWTALEVAAALIHVLSGEASTDIKTKAKALAKLCQDRGSGAANAARAILAECRDRTQVKEKVSDGGLVTV
ncbi:hypothetical protein L249_1521 [Ophiocordyceps polyrhachis-furcata BCC 54312]|uniref:Glycosyltransferase family 28 N-terminal domain-containing protein n=1 Tax=Ophiocordyceps polyrhachis-furcata BCC 54312 TaxID=1330021 RepID=A0A367L460_9HYPO|nr:hypothetical protein L249_1521 [Ophiocordyceps polyrhachis-furcata BCC 54312]